MNTKSVRDVFVQKELRLHLTLSGRCGRAEYIALWHRLHTYLLGSGLQHSMGWCSLVVRAEGREIFPLERALLLSWLTQQPDVVLVRIERRLPQPKGTGHGQG